MTLIAKAENLTLGDLLDKWIEEELKPGALSNGTVSAYVPYKIGKLQIQGFSEPATPKNKITELSHYAKGRPVKTTGGLFAWKARKEAEIF